MIKKIAAAVFVSVVTAVSIIGCGSGPLAQEHRGVYLLFSPTKERLAKLDQLQEMFEYIINDLSPGDEIIVDSNEQAFTVAFSKDPAQADQQKRSFRRQLKAYIAKLKPALACSVDNAIERAKEYLEKDQIRHKSIILCSSSKPLERAIDELDGYTVSLLNFIDQKIHDVTQLKERIEEADGEFVLASKLKDLDRVLAYR